MRTTQGGLGAGTGGWATKASMAIYFHVPPCSGFNKWEMNEEQSGPQPSSLKIFQRSCDYLFCKYFCPHCTECWGYRQLKQDVIQHLTLMELKVKWVRKQKSIHTSEWIKMCVRKWQGALILIKGNKVLGDGWERVRWSESLARSSSSWDTLDVPNKNEIWQSPKSPNKPASNDSKEQLWVNELSRTLFFPNFKMGGFMCTFIQWLFQHKVCAVGYKT